MRRRQPFPVPWLMTDERLTGDLPALLRRLPRGTGVVFRHHATSQAERRNLVGKVRKVPANGQILLVLGGRGGIGGAALPTHGRPGALSWPAHNRAEAVKAVRLGARILFVSPVFATRSHPGGRPLGPRRAAAIVRGLPVHAVALGGMTPERFQQIKGLGFDGWAAIDAWSEGSPRRARTRPLSAGQKRKAVPT